MSWIMLLSFLLCGFGTLFVLIIIILGGKK